VGQFSSKAAEECCPKVIEGMEVGEKEVMAGSDKGPDGLIKGYNLQGF
jgi:hypothetical protein